MTTACYFHPLCLAHEPGKDHSERSERLREIIARLQTDAFAALKWPTVSPGRREDIERVHTADYIDFVFASVPRTGYRQIEVNEVVSDDDGGEVTTLSPQSGQAVLHAVGAVTGAVDDVMTGKITNAFCAVRPPGHHALPHKAMGFCVFGNVVIGARYAQSTYKAGRVMIVDFDVHHGNGTQAAIETDPSLLMCSIQQLPLWPETGYAEEKGVGNILNLPVSPGLSRQDWLQGWQQKALPWIDSQDFDLLFISAGFDAHKDDPKGDQNLESEDYAQLTRDLMRIAAKKCSNRLIVVLEGGYDIQASAASAAALVRNLMTAV